MARSPAAPVLALLLAVPAAAVGAGPFAGLAHADGADRLLLAFDPGQRAALAAQVAASGGLARFPEGLAGIALVDAPAGGAARLADALRVLPGVASVEPDRPVRAHFVPDDPRFPAQYGPQQIRAPEAWDLTRGSRAVRVAVLDTGVLAGHPDLAANLCLATDFTGLGLQDEHGHGTHVAGIAGAGLDNGEGIAGMSNACILSARVLDGDGSGMFSWVIAGIGWALTQGARVITMSLGAEGNPGIAVENAVRAAFDQGVFLDASAGNDGCPQLGQPVLDAASASAHYPAAFSRVMAVAATSEQGGWDVYSNCGPQVDLAAPGTQVLSALPPCGGGVELCSDTLYGQVTGTSMAAPHVAGVAALMLSVNPGLTPREVFCFLAFTAQRPFAPSWDPLLGWGQVDAAAAVARALDGPPLGQGPLGPYEATLCDRMLEPAPLVGSVL